MIALPRLSEPLETTGNNGGLLCWLNATMYAFCCFEEVLNNFKEQLPTEDNVEEVKKDREVFEVLRKAREKANSLFFPLYRRMHNILVQHEIQAASEECGDAGNPLPVALYLDSIFQRYMKFSVHYNNIGGRIDDEASEDDHICQLCDGATSMMGRVFRFDGNSTSGAV